jgi:hypothetical protein
MARSVDDPALRWGRELNTWKSSLVVAGVWLAVGVLDGVLVAGWASLLFVPAAFLVGQFMFVAGVRYARAFESDERAERLLPRAERRDALDFGAANRHMRGQPHQSPLER